MGVIEHSTVIENAVTLGGGGGSLTPPATLTGTDPATTPLTLIAAAAQAAPYLVIQRPSADYQGVNMTEWQDETGAPLAYLDENGDLWASHNLDATGHLTVGGALTAGANSTITGDLTVSGLHSNGAVEGASATITGAVGAGSVAATGNVGAASVTATGSVTAPLLATTGGAFTTGDDGIGVQLADIAEPGTPSSGIVLWSASGVLHAKGPNGVDHALW